eukprot:349209_1
MDDQKLDAFYADIYMLIKDPAVRKWYKESKYKLKPIEDVLKTYESNYLHHDYKVGMLVKLKESDVDYAHSYPFAIIRKVEKHSQKLNIRIAHAKRGKERVESVRGCDGWINHNSIERIVSRSTNRKEQLAAFSTEQFLATKQICRQLMSSRDTRFTSFLVKYLGTKIRKSLNETNFIQQRRKQKPTIVNQDADPTDVNGVLIPILEREHIKYTKTASHLTIHVNDANQLTTIIGGNVLNEKDGAEYFIKYPLAIKYGYKYVFPHFVANIKILKRNCASNFER